MRETGRVRLKRDENDVWQGHVTDLKHGALYGYRVHGPWAPAEGRWFNPRKLLLDPYAKAIAGAHRWHPHMQNLGPKNRADLRDDAAVALKSVVVNDAFDWGGDTAPQIPWADTVIDEMHVRGFTMKHPDVPTDLRGTYAGLAHPKVIDYLKKIGITAVQLLPVHQHLDDGFLISRGLTNFWGYNSIGFFAPHSEYAAAQGGQAQVEEFKTMVREFHRAGIEVILDVVYNHTAEGDENGPMIFFRGLDNAGYYMLNGGVRVVNYTGTGNTYNAASPPALRLVMDSLRYWVQVMHVDGFRFDLAATMGRRGDQFDYFAPFFQAVAQDPVLRNVKMIAEPWDIGPNGYQVGGFPKPWRELNGRYRDRVRRFWRGDSGAAASFAKRLCGSQEIYGPSGRSPLSSVNFVISHDGFTLRDLWTYNEKHNEANGEENRDGDSNNHGWNAGVEGETDDEEINATRRKLVRACLATMFCSLGVPFLCAGDERWRTQGGNNNAYCQDNEVSWLDWAKDDVTERMTDFVAELARFRRETPSLRRATHFTGRPDPLTGRQDVAWLDPDGSFLSHERWHDPERRAFGAILDGALLLLFNTSNEKVVFSLPSGKWSPVFDTAHEPSFGLGGIYSEKATCSSRSLLCLRKPLQDN